ncbi:MAG: hydroxymethylbilane synthase [Pseudomonadota bacterium]
MGANPLAGIVLERPKDRFTKMKIIIGTRGSSLALAQARSVGRMLEAAGARVEITEIKTSGDKASAPLAELGGKGLFVKEIDEALLSGRIDVAVHSMKDVPGIMPEGIEIAAVPEREDARDAFVSRKSDSLSLLPMGARVGTSSPRRRALLLKMRGDLDVVPMSGNVETRLKKLEKGEADAVILAVAGLRRLEAGKEITEILPVGRMIPAIGQGALAVEARSSDRAVIDFVHKACHHAASGIITLAERSLLKAVGGDCYTPLAGYAEIRPSGLHLVGFLATKDGRRSIVDCEDGPLENAAGIGRRLGERMLKAIS